MKLKSFNFLKKVFYHPDTVNKILSGSRPFPTTIEIDLTNHCNHRCSFCVWGEHIATDKSSLSTNVIKNCILEMKKLGAKAITFTGGGEPMIHKGFYEILNFSKELGFDCGLITNGSVIIEKNISKLLKSLKWLRVSLSGGDKKTYFQVQGKDQFDLVMKNLSMLNEYKNKFNTKTKIGIRMLVTEENFKTLSSLCKILCKFENLNFLQIAPDHSNNDGGKFWNGDILKKEIDLADAMLKKKNIDFITSGFELLNTDNEQSKNILNIPSKCYAHFFQIAIMADGSVAYCKNARFDSKYILGNINQTSITEIWNCNKNKEFERWVKPSNCGLLCKNIRVNLGVESINQDLKLNKLNFFENDKLKDYEANFPDDPLDKNFIG